MTPNCLLLENQPETFLVQILIYKNRIVKRIIREDKERDQEETQNCQKASLPFYTRLSELKKKKIQSPSL